MTAAPSHACGVSPRRPAARFFRATACARFADTVIGARLALLGTPGGGCTPTVNDRTGGFFCFLLACHRLPVGQNAAGFGRMARRTFSARRHLEPLDLRIAAPGVRAEGAASSLL